MGYLAHQISELTWKALGSNQFGNIIRIDKYVSETN